MVKLIDLLGLQQKLCAKPVSFDALRSRIYQLVPGEQGGVGVAAVGVH